jgi:hypothetical protein
MFYLLSNAPGHGLDWNQKAPAKGLSPFVPHAYYFANFSEMQVLDFIDLF